MMLILNFLDDDTLKIKNKEKTTGEIIDIVNIEVHKVRPRGRYGRKSYTYFRYTATIIVKYEVNGTNYYGDAYVSSRKSFNISRASEYSIGDKICVVYNEQAPEESSIDEIEVYETVLYIIGAIFLSGLIYILYEKNFGKKKNLCLKVIEIKEINYQTERIFLEDELSKKIFFIEYDFGERIKTGDTYNIPTLYRNNYKNQTVMLKNENVKAYQIINIDKDRFFKTIM